jgi:FtsP/CotA-like multicopper oxidase with cupredoxin domain
LIGSEVPSWDLTVNYVTISSCTDYPQPCTQFVGVFNPGVLQMKPGEKQLWRVVNSTPHIPLHLQLLYDGALQTLQLVAIDGVPVNAHDGAPGGRTIGETDIIVPPAGTAEFIVKGPSASVQNAFLQTLRFPTGPTGDNHPQRPLFNIQTSPEAPAAAVKIPGASNLQDLQGFDNQADAKPTKTRNLYFSEVLQDPNNPLGPTNFYLTEGTCFGGTCTGTPTLFSPNNPPALVTTQGSVEDWTIQNTATENHAFHIHNLHFLVVAVNGVPLPKDQQSVQDVVLLPFWDGVSAYPSVTVRLDFRGADVGDLLYECTFLTHADFGMRAFVRVAPNQNAQ